MNLVGLYHSNKVSYNKRHSLGLNKISRKHIKRSKIHHKNSSVKQKNPCLQNGGEIVSFQVYFFTNESITEPTKSQLMNMLINLYGEDISYSDDTIAEQMLGKLLISEWVENKSEKYRRKQEILGFSINTIPIGLRGDMNDDKLTHEETRISSSVRKKKLPFKLTDGQPGIWSEELAIIAFENK